MERRLRILVMILLVAACAPAESERGFSLITSPPIAVSSATTTTAQPSVPAVTTTTTTPTVPAYAVRVAQASAEVDVYAAPNSPVLTRTVPATTILGSPTVLPIVAGPIDGWIKVELPGRPNESTGWVEATQFTYAEVQQRIEVDLAASTLTFFVEDEPMLTTQVAVGSPDNPTPPGRFFVTDIVKLTDPSGPWGPYALGLSARSDTITEFNGGDGIIGIHGTNRPDRIGEPVSLGCVRVPNEVMEELAHQVQLGIPVVIK